MYVYMYEYIHTRTSAVPAAQLQDSVCVFADKLTIIHMQSISPKTVSVAHTPRGVFSGESPTLLFDGQSPSHHLSSEQENAQRVCLEL